MQHALIEGYTRPKAKLDPIFQMKREIIKFCSRLADIRKNNPRHLYILEKHISTSFVKARIHSTYYDFLESKEFDRKMLNALAFEGEDGFDGYKVVCFTQDFIARANRLKAKPHYPAPPLYLEQRKIKTTYENSFYARFELDCFDHLTLVTHQKGKEWFFANMQPRPANEYYPIWHQPFLSAKGLESHFSKYNTTFAESYTTMKGLFNAWYGFKF